MNSSNENHDEVFSKNSIAQLRLYATIEEKALNVVSLMKSFLSSKENRRGIPIFSVSTRQGDSPHKFKVKERDGTDILKVSWTYTSIRLETSTLKANIGYNHKIALSERDSKDATWSETTYTSGKGKQINGQEPQPFSSDDGDIIVNKILENVFKKTLPSMITLKDNSFVSRFEKAVRSSMSKILDTSKIDVTKRAQITVLSRKCLTLLCSNIVLRVGRFG